MRLHIPNWISKNQGKKPRNASFYSGAALGHLGIILTRPEIPNTLLRDRLALLAAEACIIFSGRPERATELRDTLHLRRANDLPGPAGEVYLTWRRATERHFSVNSLNRAMPSIGLESIAERLNVIYDDPIISASKVLEAMLNEKGYTDVTALVLADAVLAKSLRWDFLLPFFALGLNNRDLHKRGDEMTMACYHAVNTSAIKVTRMALKLTDQAKHLQLITPKLRAKNADHAVQVFLSQDAVAPTALPLRDRSARRLCERLVELRAVRELTGRTTSRLYGI